MSGKMKKLICALLTGTMLLSSAGMLAFADADAPSENDGVTATETEAPEATDEATEDAEATEAPEAAEATEAPAAPAAPAAVATKYDSDNYYQKALALCQGLGIIKGDEQGNVNPENLVTRAEMAAIILRMLNNNGLSTYQNIFSDVSSSHWAADTVQTASALGIVNGFPGGTFVPDGDVQYEQVAKMIVCAMNYQNNAEYYGGYPNGYMKAASDLDITKSAPGSVGVATERGVVIKMVYNALLADFNEPNGLQYGQQQYKADKTLAEYAFGVKEAKGILLGTSTTSLTGSTLLKGQAAIKENGEDNIFVYQTALENLDDVLASNVTFYYMEEDGDTRELLAIVENTAKTTTKTLTNDDLDDVDTDGFKVSKGKIEMYSSKDIKIATDATIIYNGAIITEDDYNKAVAADTGKKDPRFWDDDTAKTFDQFLQPVVGTVKLVNNDDDSEYDIVFIDSYETLLVISATSKKVTGNINGKGTTIDVDEDSNDLTIKTTINGMTAAPRNLKKNNVASLKRSFDGDNMEFVVTGETITGSINSILENEDGTTTVTISGTNYDVDANAVDKCKVGSQATFYLDMFNRIGYIETAVAEGVLQAGEKYGWIVNAYNADNGQDKIVELYTQDGKTVEATLGSKVDFWASGAENSESLKASEVLETITKNGVIDNDKFMKMKDGKGNNTTTSIRLVKYKMNSKNEISRLYCAVDSKSVTNEEALRINVTNMSGVVSMNGSVGGYQIPDGIIEFTVPENATDMTNASNYKVGEAAASNYVVTENGSSRSYLVGEFSDKIKVNIIIYFTGSATDPATLNGSGGVDTAGNGPSMMVVNNVSTGYDKENDMPIYVINGYKGGSPVSVTTNRNTSYGEAQANGSIRNDKYFGFTGNPSTNKQGITWTAAENGSTPLTNYIKKGDILLYVTNEKGEANLLAQFASAADAKFNEETGAFVRNSIPTLDKEHGFNSNSRIKYFFDEVEDYEISDIAWVKLSATGAVVQFDSSIAIDLVTIKPSGVTVEKAAAEATDIQQGDNVFVAYGDKGRQITGMIIYRVEE